MNKRQANKLLRQCAAEAVARYEAQLWKRGSDGAVGMIWFGLLQRMHAALDALGEPIAFSTSKAGWTAATKPVKPSRKDGAQ